MFKQDITNSNYGLEVEKTSKPKTTIVGDKKADLELTLTSRVEGLIKKIEKAERNNGFIGKAWSGIKDLFNTNSSIKRVKEIRSKEEQLLEELKNGSKKLEEVFKELTGAEVTENNIEQFLKGEIKLESEKVLESYIEGQEMTSDVVGDIVSGIAALGIYTAAVAAAPFSGGASIAVGFAAATAAGAGIKAGIKALDTIGADKQYTTDNLKHDLATGAFSGALAPVTGGLGGAVGKGIATKFGIEAVKQVGKKVAEGTVATGVKQTVKTALTNPAGYKYTGGSAVKRATALGAEMMTDGAAGGAIDNAFRTAYDGGSLEDIGNSAVEGFVGGAILSPVIGGGMKLVGKGVNKLLGSKAITNEEEIVIYEDKSSIVVVDKNGKSLSIIDINNKLVHKYLLKKGPFTSEEVKLLFPTGKIDQSTFFMQEINKIMPMIDPEKHIVDFISPLNDDDYDIITKLFNVHDGKYKYLWLGKSLIDNESNINKLAMFARILKNLKNVDLYLNFDENTWDIITKGIIHKPRYVVSPLIMYKIDSGDINGALTGGNMTYEIKGMINAISTYISQNPIEKDVVVYRGETSYWIFGDAKTPSGEFIRKELEVLENCNNPQLRESFITNILMDLVFEYPRFLSTAFIPSDAESRAIKIFWNIEVPAGTKGIMIESYNIERESESEFLIQRCSELSIDDVVWNPTKKRLEISAVVIQRRPLTKIE